jgi:hypothetical protein
MTAKPTGFHVRHDLRPDFTYELLTLLYALPDRQSEEGLREAAEMHGYALRQRKNYGKMLRSLDELGIVSRSRSSITLTDLGRIVSDITRYQKDLLGELVHILYYTSYSWDKNMRFSWSYRTVANWLWDSAPCEIHRDRLVNIVSQAATEKFNESGVSFSTQSVGGILHWLTALEPACVDERSGIFNRRNYCPVETFMLALNTVYKQTRDDFLSIELSDDIKEAVCRICLITPESFDEMLDLAEKTFPVVQVWRKRGERLAITDFSWEMLTE